MMWLGGSMTAQAQTPVSYVYDELGRLIAVVSATDTAIYKYDAVGNLLSITRRSSSLVSIIDFWPRSGPAGTVVTISGTNFGSLASQNAVTFNGITATVTSASATQLTVTVPAGATSGPIRVTAPTGVALSATPFTLTAAGSTGAPTITSFTPTMGAASTAVTITGTNFDPVPVNDRVSFKTALATVSSATSTTIATSVPSAAQSGRLTVATAYGTAVTTSDFFLLPPGVIAGNVGFSGRITIGGTSLTAILSLPGKVGLVIFDAVAGQRVNLGLTNVTMASSAVSILKPDGSLLSSNSVGTGGGSLDSPVLPITGTYTILIAPAGTNTGAMTLTLSAEVTGTIMIGGATVTATTTRAGQNARYTFSGTAGQQVSLNMTTVSTTPAGGPLYIYLYKPDGSSLASTSAYNGGSGFMDTQTLPITGTYTLLVDPPGILTASVAFALLNAHSLAGSIAIDGPPVTVTTTVPGQNARYTFNGTAGQRVNLKLTGVTIISGTVSLLKPDGTGLTTIGLGPGGASLDPPPLPVTGTYTIFIDPGAIYTGSVTLKLVSTQDLTGSIAIDGPPVIVTTAVAGQNARYTFNGIAGQRVNLGWTGVTIAWGFISLLKPDGTTFVGLDFNTSGSNLDRPEPLPMTGTYTVLVDPSGTNTGSITLTLSSEITSTIAIGGPAVTATAPRPGQHTRYTFSGTAGQQISLALTSVTTTPAGGYLYVFMYLPDGNYLTYTYVYSGNSGFIDTLTLPTTGTYAILVEPTGAYIGSMTLKLANTQALTGSIAIDGPPVTVTTTVPGQPARYTFNGTAGQRVNLGMTGVTIASGTVSLLKPDGTTFISVAFSAGSLDRPGPLPVTGTYTLLVDPTGANIGSITLTLSSEIISTMTIGGPAVTATTTRPGQHVRYTFTGTASQQVSLALTSVTTTPAGGYIYAFMYKADGSDWTYAYAPSGGSGFINTQTLASTGTYAILVEPTGAYIGSMTLKLATP